MIDMIERKKTNPKVILDVGVGPGAPLKTIINRIPKDTNVLGIDINKNYIQAA